MPEKAKSKGLSVSIWAMRTQSAGVPATLYALALSPSQGTSSIISGAKSVM